jgi:hypothetical protein
MRKSFIHIASFLLLLSFLTKMGEGLYTGITENKVFIEYSGDEKKEAEKEKNGGEDKISYGLSSGFIPLSTVLIHTGIPVRHLSPGYKDLPFLPPDLS